MPAGLIRLISTSYLIVFLIGGGRVCGCEALSWIGVDVHHSESSLKGKSTCSHHHHTDVEDEGDHQEGGESGRSNSDQPANGGGNCCDLALKSMSCDTPKKLVDLSDLSTFSELAPVALTGFNLVNLSLEAATKGWSHPVPPIASASLKRLIQQRFNV